MSAVRSPFWRRRASTLAEREDARHGANVAKALRHLPFLMPLCMSPADIAAQDAIEGREPRRAPSHTPETL